jgi:N6-adenosine-specific RNA methylase IME4
LTHWTDDLTTLITEGLTFGCLYVDPPWDYDHRGHFYSAGRHYPTMPLEALQALPVAQLAADDAHVHLWTTTSFLREALALIEAWAFTYKSMLVWDKRQVGTGSYWRVHTEFLLLGVRGTVTRFRRYDLGNVYRSAHGQHSRKPDIVRTWIEQVSPGPYLELFGREAVEGWTVFGNEPPSLLVPGTTTQPRCAVCRQPFPAKRRSGKYCGETCRQRAHRARHANVRALSVTA